MEDNNNRFVPQRSCGVTPLLYLLDGVLAQDEVRVGEALQEMKSLGCLVTSPTKCPTQSRQVLLHVVSALLEAYPESAAIPSEHDDSLPIHFAASLGSMEVAKLILSKYPNGAFRPNQKGKIALHYAAREGHSRMVEYLLQAAPATASVATDKGKLAIHFAAGEGHGRIVNMLLQQHPRSAALSTSKGKLALHFSARWGYVEVSKLLLKVFPDGIRALDWEGSLPLHDAAREGQVQMAKYLIELFPEALRVANIRSETPLFPAVQSQNMELVLYMLQAWPAGGKYVLQNVGENDDIWPWEFVEVLLRGATWSLEGHELLNQQAARPKRILDYDVPPTQFIGEHNVEGAKLLDRVSERMILWNGTDALPHTETMTDRQVRSKSPVLLEPTTVKGCRTKLSRKRKISTVENTATTSHEFLALHAAFQAKVSPVVLQRVLVERPGDLCSLDAFGRYPLHWAVTSASPHVVAKLSNKDSGLITETSACTRDMSGKMPMHIAIEEKAPVVVIKRLLEVCPHTAVSPSLAFDESYGRLPIQMAIMGQCETSIVFELLRADPTFVTRMRQQSKPRSSTQTECSMPFTKHNM